MQQAKCAENANHSSPRHLQAEQVIHAPRKSTYIIKSKVYRKSILSNIEGTPASSKQLLD